MPSAITFNFNLCARRMINSTVSRMPRSATFLRSASGRSSTPAHGKLPQGDQRRIPVPKSSRTTPTRSCFRCERTVDGQRLGSAAATLSVISRCSREGSMPVCRRVASQARRRSARQPIAWPRRFTLTVMGRMEWVLVHSRIATACMPPESSTAQSIPAAPYFRPPP